jgi:hypothetical protein
VSRAISAISRSRIQEGTGRESIMVGRTYLVTYTDGQEQAQPERGCLDTPDQGGFVVLEVNSEHLLIPNARIDALVGVG